MINTEELLPLVQDRDLEYAALESILLLVPRHAQIAPLEHILALEVLPIQQHAHHAPLEHFLSIKALQVQVHAKIVPLEDMALQAALVQTIHVLDPVQLGIHALRGQLMNMEELLQAVLVLLLECVLLENILLEV